MSFFIDAFSDFNFLHCFHPSTPNSYSWTHSRREKSFVLSIEDTWLTTVSQTSTLTLSSLGCYANFSAFFTNLSPVRRAMGFFSWFDLNMREKLPKLEASWWNNNDSQPPWMFNVIYIDTILNEQSSNTIKRSQSDRISNTFQLLVTTVTVGKSVCTTAGETLIINRLIKTDG